MSILFFMLWIVLNGRVTMELMVIGIVVATLVSFFAWSVMGYSANFELRLLKNLPLILLYVINLLREILIAALSVMKAVLTGKKPEPVIVEFHSGLSSPLKNVFLANCITLTPGTYTIFQEGDRFVVHCLTGAYAEGLEDSSFIQLLRRMK